MILYYLWPVDLSLFRKILNLDLKFNSLFLVISKMSIEGHFGDVKYHVSDDLRPKKNYEITIYHSSNH